MKVLVIGGTGTIGLGIIKECLNRKFETYTISRGFHDDRLPKKCKIIKGDIKQPDKIRRILENYTFDVIFDGLVFRLPNLKSSLKMYKNKCKHYIFVSTTGIYARNEKRSKLSENSELGRTEWEYNKGKIECEKYLEKNKDLFNFKYTIVRPSVTYGDRRIPYTIVDRKKQWSLIERIKAGKPIVGCNNVKFSICHLDDFSRAVVGLFMNEKAYGKAFHIGGEKAVYWDDVIFELEKHIGQKAQILHIKPDLIKIYFPELYMEIKYNKSDSMILNNKKIENTVKEFKPKIKLEEGIERTYKVLKKEQENLAYDKYWNDIEDILIYVSYKKGILSNNEKIIAENYIKKLNIKNIKKIILHKKLKYPILTLKNKLKKLLHKVM